MKNILIFVLILISLITVLEVLNTIIVNNNYIYKCTDYKGNVVFCKKVYTSTGGMFGYLEDGTKIIITSYKMVLEED